MTEILLAKKQELTFAGFLPQVDRVAGWRWRDRNGRWFYPKDMETRHVFFTIRMIWNNAMPQHMAFRDARFYHFGPTYTDQYLKEALVELWCELTSRANIPNSYLRDIETMKRWLRGPDPALEEGPKKITGREINSGDS
jgi:hypothetical protein